MRNLIYTIMLMLSTVAAWSQVQEPAGCGDKPLGTVCKVTFPNGTTLQTLADGSSWAGVITPAGERVTVQINVTHQAGPLGLDNFSTNIIANRPEKDVVNGPKSDRTTIVGDCKSRTYIVMGGVSFSGTNAGGYPMDTLSYSDLQLMGQADVVRRVLPDTNVSIAFAMLCK